MNALVVYLLGSVGGIVLMVGLNVALFARRTAALDPDSLEARLALDYPGFRAGAAVMAGEAALIENAVDGALYLARAGGGTYVTRRISGNGIRRISRDGPALELRFSDFTFPRARLSFADSAEAAAWEERLRRA
ncbi:MAG: hypothetical protein ACREHE_00790 [Rhizomicrobium sp.]